MPFEFKVVQVFYHLLPPNDAFREKLEELVFRNYFFNLEIVQRVKNDIFFDCVRKKEDIPLLMENEEDFGDPPQFEYITKNILTDKVYLVEAIKIHGCECVVCSKDSNCCPKLMKEVSD